MALVINHPFVSAKADGTDSTEVQPSDWNADHAATMVTSRILGRVTASTGPVEELTAAQVVAFLLGDLPVEIPSGSIMLFQQTSAPSGWTKLTTHNNKALRVVSGAASSGGTTPFTTVFTARTLTVGQLPSHSHGDGTLATTTDGDHTHTLNNADDVFYNGGSGHGRGTGSNSVSSPAITVNNAGSHSHDVTGSTSTTGSGDPIDFAVQYVDIILASKD